VVAFGDWTIAYSPAPLPADATPPTVTNFVIPSTAASLTVNITTFTATDNVAVTGYLLTETSTAPRTFSLGLERYRSDDLHLFEYRQKTLYAWAKDAAGNVSTSLNDSVTITQADATLRPSPTLLFLRQPHRSRQHHDLHGNG